jgi:lantibiotic transport system ATP-binding protein
MVRCALQYIDRVESSSHACHTRRRSGVIHAKKRYMQGAYNMLANSIETASLGRQFGEIQAVKELSLHVPRGSIFGFLGPNGAGKTTTIRMLLGLIRPSRGQITIFGLPLAQQRMAILRQVGALVESPSLYPHLTGRENLEVTRRLIRAPKHRIDRVLAIVDLQIAADRLVREYSFGMRQRLGLALALLGEPKLLILDEPTNGLDPAGIHAMRDLLRSLPGEHGITVFLSSHLLSEVELIASHIAIINAGSLYFQGTLADLHAQHAPELTITVRPAEQAYQLLLAHGWQVRNDSPDTLQITGTNQQQAADLNMLLIQHGLHVFQLHHQQPSLEQLFLGMTTTERNII